jgi:hypothetical protein
LRAQRVAAFGVKITVVTTVLVAVFSPQPPPEQHAILSFATAVEVVFVVADVAEVKVFTEQQSASAFTAAFWSFESFEVLASPAWTATANTTNREARRSFFIPETVAAEWENATQNWREIEWS